MKNLRLLSRITLVGFAAILSISSNAFAQSSGKLKPLYFQADKNNLQVLPQRFEYTLLDEERLKVGDVLIDATQITFELIPSKKEKGKYSIRFNWPAGLLNEGEIAIKNNSGKAIFSTEFNKKSIRISDGHTKSETSDDVLRSEIAEYTADNIDASLIEDLKFLPFMSFCIYRVNEETRIYLCSKELYMTQQNGQMVIAPRSSNKKAAQVEINNEVVGNQGMIYLNDRSETVSFVAQTQSGASLEIDTRKQDVDFKDVVLEKEGKKITLVASGAEPVDESKVKQLGNDEWQIDISAARPIVYLKGEGDIPMRQEFFIKGTLPYEKDRPYLSGKSPTRTYQSSLYLLGVYPEGMKIGPMDKNSTVEMQKKNQFLWKLNNIPSGATTRYYLNAIAADRSYTVGYDITRARPYELFVGAAYQTPAGIAFARMDFQWWIENMFGSPSGATRLHWGLGLHHDQHLTKKDGEPSIDKTTFEILWRAKEGFYLIDPTWGLSLPVQMISGEGFSTTAFGLGAFWQNPTAKWMKKFSDWSLIRARYMPSGSGSDVKLKSSMEAEALLSKGWTQNLSLQYGLGFTAMKFDPAAEKEDSQISLIGGLAWQF
jgi:hypothetical protein